MKIESRKAREVTILVPGGPRIDADTATSFKDSLVTSTADSGSRHVLDLSAVEFIDSSGLGAIVSALKRMTREGRQLELSNLRPSVRQMFRLTRMDRVFTIHDQIHDALHEVAHA